MNAHSSTEFTEHPTLSTSWLEGVRRLDPESWSRLVGAFGPIVYQWCRVSGIGASDASDVVQDVFISVARGIGGFERQKETGSFRSWLATITRNRIRDHFRRVAKREAAEGGTDAWQRMQQQVDELDSTVDPATADRFLLRHVIASVQGEFEPKTWQAFWRSTVDLWPASGVAQELGISVASVYQAKSRVLRRVRQRMAEMPD